MQPEYLDDYDPLNATAMGMAFALADEIADAERGRYDLDEGTDAQNARLASLMVRASDYREQSNLRPFEQKVADICSGRIKFLSDW
jgi:hypothetical protein